MKIINPIEFTDTNKKKICRNSSRKYYRFRKTRFYGGCATADCLGCNLRCEYCWSQKKVWNPEKFGEFYTPKEVSEKLVKMSLPLVRVSGGEPTICKDHLLELIGLIPEDKGFILETNGILLDEDYVKNLSGFKNLYVRVSLKGVDETTFERITGSSGRFFKNQLGALDLLKKQGIEHRAAIMYDFFTETQIKKLGIADIEFETLYDYPFVMRSLKKKGIEIVRK